MQKRRRAKLAKNLSSEQPSGSVWLKAHWSRQASTGKWPGDFLLGLRMKNTSARLVQTCFYILFAPVYDIITEVSNPRIYLLPCSYSAFSSDFSASAGGAGVSVGAEFAASAAFTCCSCSTSSASSFFRSGRKRSIRFHDSVHSFSLDGSWLGGTRYPLLDMKRRTFFKFSGTASSCGKSPLAYDLQICQCPASTYEAVPLSTIHETIHDIDDLEPEIQHAVPLREEHQVL